MPQAVFDNGRAVLELDVSAFRQCIERELPRRSVFVACQAPPQPGTNVVVVFRVPGLGEAELSGQIASITPSPCGANVAVGQQRPEALAALRALYQRSAPAAPASPARPPAATQLRAAGEAAEPPAAPRPPPPAPAVDPDREQQQLKPGDVIDGRFEIEQHLASGGMGEVYRARHVHLKRRVALKLLNRSVARDPAMAARFHREAEIVGQLESPHVVKVHDFGSTAAGQLFLAMEFVDGAALNDLLAREGALAPERAVHLLGQICSALAEAHAKGIIHRDLKPPNIMIVRRPDGTEYAKVLDFGIARLADNAAGAAKGLTRAGFVLGTPEYLAPEQALAAALDSRTDVYSLGVVAFEMLTGRLPFESDSLQKLLSMHINTPPPPPNRVRPELSAWPELTAAVLKALRKEKDQRYQDAAAFGAALGEAVARPGASQAPAANPDSGCPACGGELAPGATFCGHCGAALRCPRCAAPASPGAAFCLKCGAHLKASARSAAPGVRPAAAPRARVAPAALSDALAELEPHLTRAQAEALLAARAALAGDAQGAVVCAGLVGAGGLAPHAGSDEAAAQLVRRCRARLLWLAHQYGAVLDHVAGDELRLLVEGEADAVAERASRLALALRDAVLEERRALGRAAPLNLRAAVCAGAFEACAEGEPARGEAADAAAELAQRAGQGAVLIDPVVAASAAARLEKRQAADRRSFELTGAKPPPVPAPTRISGREAELARIDAALAAAAAGRPGTLVVHGPPGAGRTRFADEIAARGRAMGLAVAQARGAGPQAMAALLCGVCGVPEQSRGEQLRPALETLGVAPADLGAALVCGGVSPSPPGFGPAAAAHAIVATAAAVGRARGVVLVLDDVDPNEADALGALRALARRAPARCLVVAVGPPELGAALQQAQALPLGALAGPGLAALQADLFGGRPTAPEVLDVIGQRSRGLPAIALDWAQLLFDRGWIREGASGEWTLTGAPPELDAKALASARIDSLNASARLLFEVSCLLGDPFEAAVAEASAGDARGAAGWARLERAGLVRALPERRWTVASRRYRDAVLVRGAGAGRGALHRKIAQALQGRLLDAGQTPLATEIARHLARGEDWGSAATWWQRAAEAAIVRGDHREAALRLEALAEALAHPAPPSNDVAMDSAQALGRAVAQACAAADHGLARRLADASKPSGDAEAECERNMALARLLRLEGQPQPAAAALEIALRLGTKPALAALAAVESGEQKEAAGDLRGAAAAFEAAVSGTTAAAALAPWHGEADLAGRALARLGAVLLRAGDPRGALARLQQALESWRKAGHAWGEARALASLAALAAQSGPPAEAERLFRSAIEAAERAGDLRYKAQALGGLARLKEKCGDAAAARQLAAQCAELELAIDRR